MNRFRLGVVVGYSGARVSRWHSGCLLVLHPVSGAELTWCSNCSRVLDLQ